MDKKENWRRQECLSLRKAADFLVVVLRPVPRVELAEEEAAPAAKDGRQAGSGRWYRAKPLARSWLPVVRPPPHLSSVGEVWHSATRELISYYKSSI